LFSTTELGELLKLPILVHHYFEHEEEHDHISILGFLKEHYAELHKTENKHHADHHRQLPFKTYDHSFLTGNTSIVPSIYSNTEALTLTLIKSVSFSKDTSFYSHFLADIWQPPRA
jgi:hypothetical protein